MTINTFKKSLKTKSNRNTIDAELRTLDTLTSSDSINDTLFKRLSKVNRVVTSRLSFLDIITWYSSSIPSFKDLRIMFTSNNIAPILLDSHKSVRAIHTRLNSIKYDVASEYLPVFELHPSTKSAIVDFITLNLVLKFIVFSTGSLSTLWFKSSVHGGEYLKVHFDSKTNKTNFNFD